MPVSQTKKTQSAFSLLLATALLPMLLSSCGDADVKTEDVKQKDVSVRFATLEDVQASIAVANKATLLNTWALW